MHLEAHPILKAPLSMLTPDRSNRHAGCAAAALSCAMVGVATFLVFHSLSSNPLALTVQAPGINPHSGWKLGGPPPIREPQSKVGPFALAHGHGGHQHGVLLSAVQGSKVARRGLTPALAPTVTWEGDHLHQLPPVNMEEKTWTAASKYIAMAGVSFSALLAYVYVSSRSRLHVQRRCTRNIATYHACQAE